MLTRQISEGDITRFVSVISTRSAWSAYSKGCGSDDADNEWVEEVVDAALQKMPDRRVSEETIAWCTPEHVRIYWRARDGDVDKAGAILAEALQWREQHVDILYGRRLPAFNSNDMRVLAMGCNGHPIVYWCFAHQCSASVTDSIEHMAGVLEAAVNFMDKGATQFDIVVDCPGFRISLNLDPRPTLALMTMLKHPFRERLRAGFVVDAPRSLTPVWNLVSHALPPTTVKKIHFTSTEETAEILQQEHGAEAATVVQKVMRGNRTSELVQPRRIPVDFD